MSATDAIEVLAPGTLTCVQDGGRHGLRALGIGCSGAADAHSAVLANLLVGNAADAALLEITLSGPTLRLLADTCIALTGADIDARCGSASLPGWRPLWLPRGSELRLGACRRGVRSYLAIAGGIDLPLLLDSRATDLRAGFGGLQGRPLRAGDTLRIVGSTPGAPLPAPCGSASYARQAPQSSAGPPVPATVTDTAGASASTDTARVARWWIDPTPDLDLAHPAIAALLPGSATLAPASQAALLDSAWRVAPDSNRIGLRLSGPPLALAQPWTRPSEPVWPGTVQLPPDGQPIVLLADCGTTGGYSRIGHVADVDLPRLAQLRPGESLRFTATTLEESDHRACARAARLARIALAIAARTGPSTHDA